jgi:hypothetical protein
VGRRTRFERDRWISACAGLIRDGDDRLGDEDAFALATALWEQPSVRGFDPDMVANAVLLKRSSFSRRHDHGVPALPAMPGGACKN